MMDNSKWIKVIAKEFPRATPIDKLAENTFQRLGQIGYSPENTLFGTCVCRDEINRPAVSTFSSLWGENFRLAGLAGYPSAGKTGMEAFSAHVEESGHHFILFAPHIGISQDGELGVVRRSRMRMLTASCGSLCKALDQIQKGESTTPVDPLDADQCLVVNALRERLGLSDSLSDDLSKDLAEANALTLKQLTICMVEAIRESIYELRRLTGARHKFAYLGGVLINTPAESIDYFQPLCFRAERSVDKELQGIDLLSEI